MLHRVPISLNAISHDAAADLVRHVLAQGVNVTQVFVDTVGDAATYQNKLTRIFNGRIVFTVSKKADSLYKTVSAASIAAKVTRDRVLKAWVFHEPAFANISGSSSSSSSSSRGGGTAAAAASSSSVVAAFSDDDGDYDEEEEKGGEGEAGRAAAAASKRKRGDDGAAAGASSADAPGGTALHPCSAGSGYPGDALTKSWLRKTFDPLFGWPTVVRFSWSTAKDMLEKEGTKVEWEEDEADAAKAGGSGGADQMQLGAFFSAKSNNTMGGGAGKPGDRNAFFKRRHMRLVTEL